MMRLENVSWLSPAQVEILSEHHIRTLSVLASFETRDSFADVVPIDNFRALARRAREELGRDDPLEMIGQAAGHRGAVRYAGGVRFGGRNG